MASTNHTVKKTQSRPDYAIPHTIGLKIHRGARAPLLPITYVPYLQQPDVGADLRAANINFKQRLTARFYNK